MLIRLKNCWLIYLYLEDVLWNQRSYCLQTDPLYHTFSQLLAVVLLELVRFGVVERVGRLGGWAWRLLKLGRVFQQLDERAVRDDRVQLWLTARWTGGDLIRRDMCVTGNCGFMNVQISQTAYMQSLSNVLNRWQPYNVLYKSRFTKNQACHNRCEDPRTQQGSLYTARMLVHNEYLCEDPHAQRDSSWGSSCTVRIFIYSDDLREDPCTGEESLRILADKISFFRLYCDCQTLTGQLKLSQTNVCNWTLSLCYAFSHWFQLY